MHVFVINLEKDIDRRLSIEKQFEKQNLSFEFITGVQGSNLNEVELLEYYNVRKAKRNLCRELTSSEIGCALSHLKVYNKIVQESIDFALILEDDIILMDSFTKILNDIENIIKGEKPEVYLLSPGEGIDNLSTNRTINKDYVFQNYKNGFYTSSYIINNLAAQVLIKDLYPINDVADCWKRLKKNKIVDLFVILPPLIHQDQVNFNSSTTLDMNASIDFNLKFKVCRVIIKIIGLFISFYNRKFNPYKGFLRKINL